MTDSRRLARRQYPPRPDTRRVSTREGYDRWAAHYDDYDNPLVALEGPAVRELAAPVEGLDVADIGCGTGRHALWAARCGARVTGVDFSAGMLARARAGRTRGVTWVEHDITRPLPLPSAAFDRVLCCLVLEHVRELEAVLSELARLCRPAGKVIVSDLHPDAVADGVQARFSDPDTGDKHEMESTHHPIADYESAARSAGLRVRHTGEHAVGDALAARSDSARKYRGLPLLVVFDLAPA